MTLNFTTIQIMLMNIYEGLLIDNNKTEISLLIWKGLFNFHLNKIFLNKNEKVVFSNLPITVAQEYKSHKQIIKNIFRNLLSFFYKKNCPIHDFDSVLTDDDNTIYNAAMCYHFRRALKYLMVLSDFHKELSEEEKQKVVTYINCCAMEIININQKYKIVNKINVTKIAISVAKNYINSLYSKSAAKIHTRMLFENASKVIKRNDDNLLLPHSYNKNNIIVQNISDRKLNNICSDYCNICMEQKCKGETLTTDCEHLFCTICYFNWSIMNKNINCPICRKNIPQVTIYKNGSDKVSFVDEFTVCGKKVLHNLLQRESALVDLDTSLKESIDNANETSNYGLFSFDDLYPRMVHSVTGIEINQICMY